MIKMLRNKFKRGEDVIVNGIGKKDNKFYRNERGSIIDKDAFFLDYNVEFSDKQNDWFDGKQLTKIRNYKERKK